MKWSFENFGATAETSYTALIAAVISHAAQSPNSLGFKKRAALPGDILICRWAGDQLQVARLLHEVQDPTLNFDPITDWL